MTFLSPCVSLYSLPLVFQSKSLAAVAPTTLPQLGHGGKGGAGGRHGYAKHSNHDDGTLPHLRHSDSVTSSTAPSYSATPTTPTQAAASSERYKRDQYGNRIPMTPSGKYVCVCVCMCVCVVCVCACVCVCVCVCRCVCRCLCLSAFLGLKKCLQPSEIIAALCYTATISRCCKHLAFHVWS
jgi:hypothetical protein